MFKVVFASAAACVSAYSTGSTSCTAPAQMSSYTLKRNGKAVDNAGIVDVTTSPITITLPAYNGMLLQVKCGSTGCGTWGANANLASISSCSTGVTHKDASAKAAGGTITWTPPAGGAQTVTLTMTHLDKTAIDKYTQTTYEFTTPAPETTTTEAPPSTTTVPETTTEAPPSTTTVPETTTEAPPSTTTVPAGPPVPVLSDGFSSHIEAVIDNKAYSINLREYYDYDNNRLRIDRSGGGRPGDGSPGSEMTEICDYSTKKHILVEAKMDGTFKCNVTTTATCFGAGRSTDHLARASSMLEMLDKNTTYTFMGPGNVRGIACESWKSAEQTMSSPRRPDVEIAYQLEWHFMANDWNHGAQHGKRIPLLALLTGKDTNKTSGVETPFTHHYNFIDYHPDFKSTRLSDSHFAIQPEWGCVGDSTTTSPPAGSTSTSTAPAAIECGEGTELKEGKCVCKATEGTPTASQAAKRSLLTQVAGSASAALGFIPGMVAGAFFYHF